MDLLHDKKINDHLEIVRLIAEGGFGQVYLARLHGAAGFHRTVAVKRIRRMYTYSADFVSDFINEARIGGFIHHHNVVQVLGFEKIDDNYLIVMEYVNGIGLDQVLEAVQFRGMSIPLDIIADLVAQTADGLHHIHCLKDADGKPLRLVHRDIKPSNLLLDNNGLVKISDFGIARCTLPDSRKTQTGIIKGTIAYLSPEQARGENTDHRSDLYSLGSILYELLTGRRLYPETSAYNLLAQIARNAIDERLDELEHTFAAPFLPVLRGLLTGKPAERYPSAEVVAGLMRQLQQELRRPGRSTTTVVESWKQLHGEMLEHRSQATRAMSPTVALSGELDAREILEKDVVDAVVSDSQMLPTVFIGRESSAPVSAVSGSHQRAVIDRAWFSDIAAHRNSGIRTSSWMIGAVMMLGLVSWMLSGGVSGMSPVPPVEVAERALELEVGGGSGAEPQARNSDGTIMIR